MTLLGWILRGVLLSSGLAVAASESSPWSAIEVSGQGDAVLNRVMFVNDRVGWVCAGRNTLLKTGDGGRTWSVLNTNVSGSSIDLSGVWFVDENRGWAAGAISHEPTIWGTTDGGMSWTVQEILPKHSADSTGGMLDVHFANGLDGWAVGFNGPNAIIAASRDGGGHWSIKYSGSEITGQFSRVQFDGALSGWTLSPEALMQTRDGGNTWRLRHYNGALLNDIDSVHSNGAWVAGAWGHLLRTRNGVTWANVTIGGPLGDHFFGFVKFASGDRGWAWGT